MQEMPSYVADIVVGGCSLSALLLLRDALEEAAEQRCSLLDASARAEHLWGAASDSGFEPAGRAQPDQTGSSAVIDNYRQFVCAVSRIA